MLHLPTKLLSLFLKAENPVGNPCYNIKLNKYCEFTLSAARDMLLLNLEYAFGEDAISFGFSCFSEAEQDRVELVCKEFIISGYIYKATASIKENMFCEVISLQNDTGEKDFFKDNERVILPFMNYLAVKCLRLTNDFIKEKLGLDIEQFGYIKLAQEFATER